MATAESPTGILSIGHYCHDLLVGRGHGQTHALGGSVAYGASVLQALSAPFRIRTQVGEDFRYFDQCTEPPMIARGCKTTAFVDQYVGRERVARLSAICEPIRPEQIDLDARVALVCGVIGEIPVDTILAASRRAELLICDIQGLIREGSPGERLRHVPLSQTPYAAVMDRFTAVKLSLSEATYVDLERLRRQTLVLLTEDDRGCTLLDARDSRFYPTRRIEAIDPTGAGDCFLAGFAYGLYQGWEASDCANFANFCGGLAVQHVGVPRLTRQDFLPALPESAHTKPTDAAYR